VYILPALPALVIAAAPFLPELFALRGPKRLFLTLGWVLAAVASLGAVYLLVAPQARADVLADYGIDGFAPLSFVGLCSIAACVALRVQRAQWAYLGSLAAMLVTVGFWIGPVINADRSGAKFIDHVQTLTRDVGELGLVSYKEQYLLAFDRPTTNFGHARWREGDAEAFDAAAWLMAKEGRVLMVPTGARERCFASAQTTPLGPANSTEWFLVTGSASPDCVAAGKLAAARPYIPKGH
jgi:hypothetical protein